MGEGILYNGDEGLWILVSMDVGERGRGSTDKRCKEAIELLDR